MTLTAASAKAALIRGIHDRNPVEVGTQLAGLSESEIEPEARELVTELLTTCASIGAYCASEVSSIVATLTSAGIAATPTDSDEEIARSTVHLLRIRIAEADLPAALDVAAAAQFRTMIELDDNALEFLRRAETSIQLTREDDFTTQLEISWRDAGSTGRLSQLFSGGMADYLWFRLPRPLWPLYSALRPVRLVIDRVLRRSSSDLGRYFGTPRSLIGPLLDFADVTETDVLFDLGSGDGRVVVESALTRGCRAVGVEARPELVAAADSNAVAAGVDHLAEMREGTLLLADLTDATVIFLFLPVGVVAKVLESIRERADSSVRVVIHEQSPLGPGLNPDRSELVMTDSGLTVAHIWGGR